MAGSSSVSPAWSELLPPREAVPMWRLAGRSAKALSGSPRSGRGRFSCKCFLCLPLACCCFKAFLSPATFLGLACLLHLPPSPEFPGTAGHLPWRAVLGMVPRERLSKAHTCPALPLAWRLSGPEKRVAPPPHPRPALPGLQPDSWVPVVGSLHVGG